MKSAADYLFGILAVLLLVGAAVNLANGHLGQWLQAKFLGLPRAAT